MLLRDDVVGEKDLFYYLFCLNSVAVPKGKLIQRLTGIRSPLAVLCRTISCVAERSPGNGAGGVVVSERVHMQPSPEQSDNQLIVRKKGNML